MRGELDPVTREKIEAFARRRRTLIVVRGACAVFAVLLALMTALALLDYFVLMADGLRWTLSLGAYAAAVAAAWATSARYLWRAADAREIARLMEETRPELREDLLSAVELGDPSAAARWESEDFREILQGTVADRVRGVEVVRLLPLRRIRRWLWATAAVAGLGLVLMLVPELRFDHLLNRALRPMANLERISRVKVAILEPSPPERTVPQGDMVAVRIELSGPEAKSAVLETFPEAGKAERVEMSPAGGRRFESGIVVGQGAVAWRVRAGDAVTRKYVLTSVARPEVLAFRKTYTFPAYARKAPRVEPPVPGGDLVELEGTRADVELEVNTEVRGGELRIEQAGKSSAVPLVAGSGPRRLRAQVALTASGTYRVHLVAQATGFENRFSPQYEIRSMPDLVPRVTLEEPAGDLIVPPDEVVAVRGTAKDDLGLKVVSQAVRINQGEWKEWVLKEDAGAQASVTRRWDLFELGVTPGDRVATKLVATDLKGSRAESSPVTATITAPGFDPSRHVPLAAKEAAYEALAELREAAQALEKRTAEAGQAGGEELGRKQALLNAAQEAEKLAQQAEAAEARLREALRVSRAGRESDDLVLAARIVRRLRDADLAAGRAALEKASAGGTAAPAAFRQAQEGVRRAVGLAVAAEEPFRDLLASEEALALVNDLRDLSRDEEAIARQLAQAVAAKDAKAWDRLARRQGVVGNQLKTVVEELFRVFATRAERGQGQRAQRLRQELERARGDFEKAASAAASSALAGPSEGLRRTVESAWHQTAALEVEAARRAEAARDRLAKVAETSTEDVRRALGGLDRLAEAQKRQAELAGRNAPAAELEKGRAAASEASDQALGTWRAARSQLEARAGTEESRRDADAFFVSDASLAGRAAQAVLDAHQAAPEAAASRATMGIVEKALRVLETGHEATALSLALRALAEGERWHAAGADASTRHSKDWRWMDDLMKTLPERLRDAGLPAEIGKDLAKNWRAQAGDAVRAEMRERRAIGRPASGQAAPLEKLGGDVGQAVARLQPHLEAARRELRKLVPSLPERLKQLAESADKLQRKTETLSDRTAQAEPAQVRPEARELLENQHGLDKQLEEVMAELRRDANVQDLFTEQGREKARDADDAVAMLRQAPPKAEDLLAQAAAAAQRQAQEHALEKAAEQQGKLADALETLAKHYENAEKGKPEETRPELRKAEEALGIKPQLDAQYAQMEKLSALAKQSAEAQKAALTEELAKSEAMRRELQDLTQAALARAEQALAEAAKTEAKQAQALQQAAQQSEQAKQGIAEQARKLAEEARRMAAQDVAKLAQEAKAAPKAQQEAREAQQNLNEGAQAVPKDLSKPEAAAQGLEKAAEEFQAAAQDLQDARQAAQQAAQKAMEKAQAEQGEMQAAQQKAAQESQQAQATEKAAQAAEQAEKMAQEAAKAAQQAAQQQPQNQAAQQAAQQAQQRAQQSKQQTQQAKQAAQKEAGEAKAAEQAAQAEARQAQAAQQAAADAQTAAQHAGQESADAQQLAQQAKALAQQARGQAGSPPQAMAQAAQAQQQVGRQLAQAQADLQQAAQNQAAAGQAEESVSTGQVAQGVEGVRQNEVPAAQAAAQGQTPAQAAQAAQKAQQAIEAQSAALAKAQQGGPPKGQQGQPGEGSALSEAAGEFLAQALNELNAPPGQGQGQGQPQQGQGQQGKEGAEQAMQSAAQAQAQAMAQGRQPGQGQQPGQQGQQPGQSPFSQAPGAGKGAKVESGALGEGGRLAEVLLKPGEWGKLPPKLARDLMEAQREGVSGEYRAMVETYFRVIAEKAREKK